MAKDMNELVYVVRLKGVGLSCLTVEASVKKQARNGMSLVVYNLRSITKIKWLLRLSKAILNLSVQDVGILKSVLHRKGVLTLTLVARMLWSPLGSGGQNKLLV